MEFILYLFVCVLTLAAAEDGSGMCEVLCITIIGVIISALILSIPLVILVYFLTKFLMKFVHECVIKHRMKKNGPRLSIYELGEITRRLSHTRDVKNSTTMLEIIEELPENAN